MPPDSPAGSLLLRDLFSFFPSGIQEKVAHDTDEQKGGRRNRDALD